MFRKSHRMNIKHTQSAKPTSTLHVRAIYNFWHTKVHACHDAHSAMHCVIFLFLFFPQSFYFFLTNGYVHSSHDNRRNICYLCKLSFSKILVYCVSSLPSFVLIGCVLSSKNNHEENGDQNSKNNNDKTNGQTKGSKKSLRLRNHYGCNYMRGEHILECINLMSNWYDSRLITCSNDAVNVQQKKNDKIISVHRE